MKSRIDFFSEKTCLQVVSAVCVVIALFSLLAGIFTHSTALLLDGTLSVLDVIISFITLIIARLLSKPPSKTYQFGYFKLEPLLVAVQAAMMIAVCFLSILHSIKDIYHHTGFIKEYGWGFSYTLFTIILDIIMCVYVYYANKKNPSPILQLEFLGWKYGLFLTMGLFAGFCISYGLEQSSDAFIRGLSVYVDPIMTIGIVSFIIVEPFSLFFENLEDLLDRRPEESKVIKDISKILQESANHLRLDITLQSLKFRKAGRAYFCSVQYSIDINTTMGKMDGFNQVARDAIKSKFPSLYIDLIPEIKKSEKVD